MVSDNTANGLNLRCLPIHLWTHAHDATEEAGEIVRVVNAELVAYLVNLHLGIIEHGTGFLHLHKVDIVDWAVPRTFLEYHREDRTRFPWEQ